MVLSKARIVAVGETPYAHEREGIEFAEQALPDTDPFYNPRAPQIWLTAFDQPRLIAVGRRVGDLYGSKVPERIRARAGDPMVETIARAIVGQLGEKVGIAPRLFLRRLIDVLDRIEAFPEFDPAKDYDLVLKAGELSAEEAAAAGSRAASTTSSSTSPSRAETLTDAPAARSVLADLADLADLQPP